MTNIRLDKRDGSYGSGLYEVKVKTEPFKQSNLFYKTVHTPKESLAVGTIISSNLQIQFNHPEFIDDPIFSYIAYFSINDDITPLIFEISFKNGVLKQYRYNELLKFKTRVLKLSSKESSTVITLDDLIKAYSDQSQQTVFKLEQQKFYDGVNVSSIDEPDGFKKYTHSPKKRNSSILLFNNNIFNVRDNRLVNKKLPKVQNQTFNEINVYYRRDQSPIPLLIELTKGSDRFYLTRKNKKETSWSWHENINGLETELDEIETKLNHSKIVLIDRRTKYTENQINEENSSTVLTDDQIEIKVTRYKSPYKGYECYEHDLTSNPADLGVIPESFGSGMLFVILRIFICNVGIETYKENDVDYLYYHQGKNLYVYFYNGDRIPLMIMYKDSYYTPYSKEEYFNKWVIVEFIQQLDSNSEVKNKLDSTNKGLNEIIINYETNYGIPIDNAPGFNKCLDPKRVEVRDEQYQSIFNKYQHTPKNGFFFNNTIFEKKMNKGPHEDIILQGKSVSVYYYINDSDKKYPLVLEHETPGKKFIYHFLIGNDLSLKKYEKIKNKGIEQKELKDLLDHQNFIYNKVTTIRMDKKQNYTCCEKISNYIKFQRHKGNNYCHIHTKNGHPLLKSISVEVGYKTGSLASTKYSFYKHTMAQYDLKEEKLKIFGTSKLTEENKMIVLQFKIKERVIKIVEKYKELKDLSFTINIVYVYFYGRDPRPLLMCVNDKVYYPGSFSDYLDKWIVYNEKITCKEPNYNKLIGMLNKISYFLNPVNIYMKSEYNIHTEFSDDIKIMVEYSTLNCYTVYRHKAQRGFKLGEITYKRNGKTYKLFDSYDKYPKEYKNKTIISVLVYYSNCDIDNQYPLLVKLKFKDPPDAYYGFYLLSSGYKWDKLGELDETNDNQLLLLLKLIQFDFDRIKCTDVNSMCSYAPVRTDTNCMTNYNEFSIDGGKNNRSENNMAGSKPTVHKTSHEKDRIDNGIDEEKSSTTNNGFDTTEVQEEKKQIQQQPAKQDNLNQRTDEGQLSQKNQPVGNESISTGTSTPPISTSIILGSDTEKNGGISRQQQYQSEDLEHKGETAPTDGQVDARGKNGNNFTDSEITQQPPMEKETIEGTQASLNDKSHNEYEQQSEMTQPISPGATLIEPRTNGYTTKVDNTLSHNLEETPEKKTKTFPGLIGEPIFAFSALRGNNQHLTGLSGLQNVVDDFLNGPGASIASASNIVHSLLEQLTTSSHTDETQERQNFERIVKGPEPSELYEFSDSRDQAHQINRRSLSDLTLNPPLPEQPKPSEDDSIDNNCKWITSGVVSFGIIGVSSYPLYLYFEKVRVRDMRAVF